MFHKLHIFISSFHVQSTYSLKSVDNIQNQIQFAQKKLRMKILTRENIKHATYSYKPLNTDACDRREENSGDHKKWRRDIGNDVAHILVALLHRANYITLLIVPILHVAYNTSVTAQ